MSNPRPHEVLASLLASLARARPCDISPAALSTLAKEMWYGACPSLASLVHLLEQELADPLHKRRALYLLDVLRRFSCVSEDRAGVLKAILMHGAGFKPSVRTLAASERVSQFQLDELAHEWGLEEDVCQQMQYVLQYQTRHYADSQRRAQ